MATGFILIEIPEASEEDLEGYYNQIVQENKGVHDVVPFGTVARRILSENWTHSDGSFTIRW